MHLRWFVRWFQLQMDPLQTQCYLHCQRWKMKNQRPQLSLNG